MNIRDEKIKDFEMVYTVNTVAFNRFAEANLVEILFRQTHPRISLIAENIGTVVGHILFTPVTLTGYAGLKIIGLAPVAVLPEYQGKGIGSALIEEGLLRCKTAGFGACVVLDHKGYYPRFGFTPSVNFGITCEYNVPPEVFMVIELQPGYLHGASGTIQFRPAFNKV
jgi:putative acetyltransferase